MPLSQEAKVRLRAARKQLNREIRKKFAKRRRTKKATGGGLAIWKDELSAGTPGNEETDPN